MTGIIQEMLHAAALQQQLHFLLFLQGMHKSRAHIDLLAGT
jgi:hypothetical protein